MISSLIIIHGYIYAFAFGFVNYMWAQDFSIDLFRFLVLIIFSNIFLFIISKFTYQFKAMYLIILLFIYIPIGVVSSSIVISFSYFLIISAILFISLMSVFPISKISLSGIYKIYVPVPRIFLFFGVLAISGIIILSNFDSINTSIADTFSQIYQIRVENKMSAFEAYSTRFIVSIAVPIMLWYFFRDKNYLVLFCAFFICLMFFLIFAMKFQLYIFFLYFFMFSLIIRGVSFFRIFLYFILLAIILSIPLNAIGFNFIDRFLYLPGLLNILYLDYFTYNDFMYFEHSKLEFVFGGSEYKETVGFIIDAEYFGNGGMNANTGFIGSIFAQVGYVGIFCAFLILNFLALCFAEIDKQMKHLGTFLLISLSFELINAPLTNLLLSNGFIMILFIPIVFRGFYDNQQTA